jgi:hypothetical protein
MNMQRRKALLAKPSTGGYVKGRLKTSKKRESPSFASRLRKTKPVFKYVPPQWFKKLPPGASHGSNAHQKRLWRLVSEYVRQRDFKKYGCCVSCNKRFGAWNEGQAGHFKAWSVCNGMFKFNVDNLALICSNCNFVSDGVVNARFADEMRRRYGHDYVEWVDAQNKTHQGTKMDLPEIVSYAEEVIKKKDLL